MAPGRKPTSSTSPSSSPVRGQAFLDRQDTAVKRIEALLTDTAKHTNIIRNDLRQWDDFPSNTQPGKRFRGTMDEITRANQIDADQLTAIRDDLITIWAMSLDPESLPEKIRKPRGKVISWWKAILAEFGQATRNEARHFVYFPCARSHQPSGEQADPVQLINEAIRQNEPDTVDGAMETPAKATGASDDEDGGKHNTSPMHAPVTPAKRRLDDEQPLPSKQQRSSGDNTPASRPPRFKREETVEAADRHRFPSIPRGKVTTSMLGSPAPSDLGDWVPRPKYTSLKDKAKNYMEGYHKNKKWADERLHENNDLHDQVTKLHDKVETLQHQQAAMTTANENLRQENKGLRDQAEKLQQQLAEVTAAHQTQLEGLQEKLDSTLGQQEAKDSILQIGMGLQDAAQDAYLKLRQIIGNKAPLGLGFNAASTPRGAKGDGVQADDSDTEAQRHNDTETDMEAARDDRPVSPGVFDTDLGGTGLEYIKLNTSSYSQRSTPLPSLNGSDID